MGAASVLLCLAGLLLLVSGCAYFNSLYNAKRLFAEAESARWRGQDGAASARYEEVVERAARSYRSAPDGRWADDALFLVARAHARRGDWRRARAALDELLRITGDDNLRGGALLYLGMADAATGRPDLAAPVLDSALALARDRDLRAEGHFWRARVRLATGDREGGWADLDEAGLLDGRYRTHAELERLAWAVRESERTQASVAAAALLGSRESQVRADSITALVARSADTWGAAAAADLLTGAAQAPWEPEVRDGLVLQRADLLARAGDTAAAVEEAVAVTGRVGRTSDRARVMLARWRLARVDDPEELEEVRGMLLPAVGSPTALGMVASIRNLALLVERGTTRGQGPALFAAAELARDSLGAPRLAVRLFLRYADRDRGGAWEGKALLAALQLDPPEARRQAILERLDQIHGNPYVTVARREGGSEAEFQALERRLGTVLATIRQQVAVEASQRDVRLAETARMLDSLRTEEEIQRRLAAGDTELADSLRADSLRLDSLRLDSLRLDSLRLDSLRADSLGRGLLPLDTVPLRVDTVPPTALWERSAGAIPSGHGGR